MTSELSYKGVVLQLVFYFFLGKIGGNPEAWEIPDLDVIPENKVICQGDRLRLHCANASMGLTIYSALYGRTEPGHVICPYREAENDYNYNCGEVDVTEMFKTMCEKKSRCKIKVNSALFGDPCPGKHLYLNLVYACGLQRRKPKVIHSPTPLSTVTTTTSTTASTSSASTSLSSTPLISFSSTTVFPVVNMTVVSSSTVLLTRSTPRAQDPPTVHTTRTEAKDAGADNAVSTLQVGKIGSSAKSGGGDLGIAGALFVWFLFMQDYSSDFVTVFIASAAGAISLALIVGLYVFYRHHKSKQQLHVKEEPKLSGYGTTDSKASEDVDPFLLGPVKTPPPDYMLEGYNWSRGSTLPHKNHHNGSVIRTFSAKDVGSKDLNGHSRYKTHEEDT